MDPLDVVVVAGGISHERDVSLRSGRRVAEALGASGWTVRLLDTDAALLGELRTRPPQVVWAALHGSSGEDGALRDLLQAAGLRFVGATGAAARLAWDKAAAKQVVRAAGGRTPESMTMTRDVFREIGVREVVAALLAAFPVPVVVKPVRGGSAQGVTVVREAGRLPRAVLDAFTYADEALIERHVDGVEVAVGVLDLGDGAVALPAVEIEPVSGTYGFEARYTAGETRFYTPARLDPAAAADAAAQAVLAHRALGLRHLSRVDLIVDADGRAHVLEANVSPGLTETSLVPQALEAEGRDLPAAYAAIARAASLD